MAACLGVMVARISSVSGINLVGPFISTHCSVTFYCLSAFALSKSWLLGSFVHSNQRVTSILLFNEECC